MELKEFLHMKEGDGEFSYAYNTAIQKTSSSRTKPIIEKAIDCLLQWDDDETVDKSKQVLKIADLGCGLGPIPLALISTVIETVKNKYHDKLEGEDHLYKKYQVPEIQIHFNDLPSNDFNSLFKELANKLPLNYDGSPFCMVMGVPGSFHGRLFPRNSLDFVHSNYALHWLSQVPPCLYNEQGNSMNKGNINLCETSIPDVIEAYRDQFKQDWTRFLHYRSQEVVPNGCLLLVVRGRTHVNHSIWELTLLTQALASLVSKGVIEEEKLDSFEFPCYYPLKEEIEEVIQKEGSFEVEEVETILDNNVGVELESKHGARAETLAKCVWCFSHSVVSHHFGHHLSDLIYNELLQLTFKYLVQQGNLQLLSIMVLLRRRCFI